MLGDFGSGCYLTLNIEFAGKYVQYAHGAFDSDGLNPVICLQARYARRTRNS
jgi:hypothetical protein